MLGMLSMAALRVIGPLFNCRTAGSAVKDPVVVEQVVKAPDADFGDFSLHLDET